MILWAGVLDRGEVRDVRQGDVPRHAEIPGGAPAPRADAVDAGPLHLAQEGDPSGSSLVLYCTNDRREYGSASATGDRLRDNSSNTQIARLRCSHDRWQ